MTALARTGRTVEALRVFQEFRSHLVEEMGVEPSEALGRIEDAILKGKINVELPGILMHGSPPEVLSASELRPSFPASLLVPQDALPFTGRSEPLETLLRVLKTTQEGLSQSVFVLGEAGIGKSRLVAEFATRAHAGGVPIVFGRCDEDLPAGLAPFLQIARQLATAPAAGLNTDSLEQLSPRESKQSTSERRVPGSVNDAVSIAPAPAPGIESRDLDHSFSRYDAFAIYLTTVAQTWGVLVVVLEDMHWADRDSVDLLRYLVRSRTSGPLMIVCTSRDEPSETSGAFAKLLANARTIPGITRAELEGLDQDAVSELAKHLGLSEQFGVAIHEQTTGNPFFLGELLAAGDAKDVPSSVRDVVNHRVAGLGAEAHDSLQIAAVAGQEFGLSLLMTISGKTEDQLFDHLLRAVDARIIHETAIDTWQFQHALLRAALSADLPSSRRARLHGAVAEAIERERPNDISSLAFHFDRAGRDSREKALRYLQAVGASARSRFEFSAGDAAAALARAVELTDELHPDNIVERAEIRILAANVQNAAGDLRWRDSALSAVELGTQADRSGLVVAAALAGRNAVASRGLYDIDREFVNAIKTALLVAQTDDERARLLARLSTLLLDEAGGDGAAHAARQALAAARRSKNEQTLAAVLTGTLRALCRPSQCYDIADRLKELDQLVEKLNATGLRREGAIHRSTEYARIGDLAGVDRCIAALDEAAQQGSILARRSRSQLQFYRQLVIGDIPGAEKHAEQAHHDGIRTSFVGAELVWRAQMLNLGVAVGRVIDVPRLEGKDPLAGSSMSGGYQAALLIGQGKAEESLQMLWLAAGENFRNVPENYQWWSAMLTWSTVPFSLQLAGVEDARVGLAADELERLLLPHRGTFVVAQVSLEMPVDVGLGFAAYGARAFERAVEYFEGAVALCDRTGVSVHGCSAGVFLALSLAQLKGASARQQVFELLNTSDSWATEHGTSRNRGLAKRALLLVGG